MNWIKQNYDRFALALLSVGVLLSAWVLWSKTSTFEDNFADAKAAPVKNNNIVAVDTARIDLAHEHFDKPTVWKPRPAAAGAKELLHSGLLFTSELYLLTKLGMLEKPTKGALYKDSLTGKDIENTWFIDRQLPLLDATVAFQDPDEDGFLNEDEWRHQTEPTNKASHPAYETKLFLKQWLKLPFRFKFQSYDGDPKKDKAEAMTYQINPLDAGGRSKFLKIGEMVEPTKYRVTKFEFKEVPDPNTDTKDVSELTLTNVETGETVALIYNQVTDSPTQLAKFEYFWNKKHGEAGHVFDVAKFKDFLLLQPNVDQTKLYKLLDVNEAGALIQRPDGEKYQVPPVPKK